MSEHFFQRDKRDVGQHYIEWTKLRKIHQKDIGLFQKRNPRIEAEWGLHLIGSLFDRKNPLRTTAQSIFGKTTSA